MHDLYFTYNHINGQHLHDFSPSLIDLFKRMRTAAPESRPTASEALDEVKKTKLTCEKLNARVPEMPEEDEEPEGSEKSGEQDT